MSNAVRANVAIDDDDPVTVLERQLAGKFGGSRIQRVIDPATITALVSMFLGLFNACRNKSGDAKALDAVQRPGRREQRIAQRLVLRDHFNGDRRAYRAGDGDTIAAEVLAAASQTPQEKLIAAADTYREESTILDDVE